MTFAMKMKESNEIAVFAKVVASIRKGKGKVQDECLAQILDIDKEQFVKIMTMIEEHPEMDDWDIAEAIAEF